jgi:hypothetical protein
MATGQEGQRLESSRFHEINETAHNHTAPTTDEPSGK